jgi:hypothetical protein
MGQQRDQLLEAAMNISDCVGDRVFHCAPIRITLVPMRDLSSTRIFLPESAPLSQFLRPLSLLLIKRVRPELVREAKRLRRRSPKGHQRSLRDVAAELAKLGFVNQRGAEFSASSVKSMLAALWLQNAVRGSDCPSTIQGVSSDATRENLASIPFDPGLRSLVEFLAAGIARQPLLPHTGRAVTPGCLPKAVT